MTTIKQHPNFYELIGSHGEAIGRAQAWSDAHDIPVCIWKRCGWYVVCDVKPDCFGPTYQEPEDAGWTIYAVVDPARLEN